MDHTVTQKCYPRRFRMSTFFHKLPQSNFTLSSLSTTNTIITNQLTYSVAIGSSPKSPRVLSPPQQLLRLPSPMLRYRGVTPHGTGWQVQVTGKYLGWFPNQKQAVAKVASVLKMPMAKLRKRKHTANKLIPLRTHKYIYWLTKQQLWQVKLPGHKSRHFPTHAQAVEAASAALKVPPKSFRLRKGCPADHGREPASAYLARVFRIHRSKASKATISLRASRRSLHVQEEPEGPWS